MWISILTPLRQAQARLVKGHTRRSKLQITDKPYDGHNVECVLI